MSEATEIDNRSHSERMENELRAMRSLFDDAFNEGDAGRAQRLATTIATMEANIERARIREQKYLTVNQIDAIRADFTLQVIEAARRHVDDDTWAKIVEDCLGLGGEKCEEE